MRKQLGVVALALFGALLIASPFFTEAATADEPHPGLNFSIGVRGVQGCNTRADDVTCTLPSGQPFLLEFSLDMLPDDINGYAGFDLFAEYTGITPGDDGNSDDWPDCGFPVAHVPPDGGFIALACAIGVPPAPQSSSWIGPIGAITFTCAQNGSITMAHGGDDGQTDLVEGNLAKHSEGVNAEETINITCGSVPANTPGIVTGGTPGGPGPTPGQAHTPAGPQPTPGEGQPTLEPTEAANATATARARGTETPGTTGTPTEEPDDGEDDDDDSNAWVWIVIIVAAVAAVGIAGFGYWYYRTRMAGTPPSGGTPPSSGGTPPSSGSDTPSSDGSTTT
jgi:hypothetical protein